MEGDDNLDVQYEVFQDGRTNRKQRELEDFELYDPNRPDGAKSGD